jgi:hypothetical protein
MSTRTYHWRILREAGPSRQRNAGNGTFVRLRRGEFDARFPGLLDLIVDLTPSRSIGESGRPLARRGHLGEQLARRRSQQESFATVDTHVGFGGGGAPMAGSASVTFRASRWTQAHRAVQSRRRTTGTDVAGNN